MEEIIYFVTITDDLNANIAHNEFNDIQIAEEWSIEQLHNIMKMYNAKTPIEKTPADIYAKFERITKIDGVITGDVEFIGVKPIFYEKI